MTIDVRAEGRQLVAFTLEKIGREQNEIAHRLAQSACRSQLSGVSLSCVSVSIQDLVLTDRVWIQRCMPTP